MSINVFGGDGDEIDQNLDLNGYIIYNSGEPTDPGDLATKYYVDSKLSGERGWNLEGNALIVNGKIGSTNNYDVDLIRNNATRVNLRSNGTFIMDRCFIVDDTPASVMFGCRNLRANNKFLSYLGNPKHGFNFINNDTSILNLIVRNGFRIISNTADYDIDDITDANAESIAEITKTNINFNKPVTIDGNLNFTNTSNRLINCTLTDGNSFEITSGNSYINFNKTASGTNLALGGYTVFVNNLVEPITNDQAANKGYVDSKHDLQVSKTGDTMTGDLTFDGNGIRKIKCDLINNNTYFGIFCGDSNYLSFIKTISGTITLGITADNISINNLLYPINAKDATNKEYVDDKVNSLSSAYVAKDGSTMTGDLILSIGTDTIRNIGCLALPVSNKFQVLMGNANNLIYHEGADISTYNPIVVEGTGLLVNFKGNNLMRFGTSDSDMRILTYTTLKLGGAIDANVHNIYNLADPVGVNDAATKQYVDKRKCLIGYIPNLSTNVSKTGFTASASSEFSSSYAAWYTFNITSEYSWATAGIYNNFWIKIQCPDSVTVWGFALRGRGTTIERIYNWRLEGSNDNNTFTTLYTGNNDYLGPTTKFYDISSSNDNSYRYYRLYAVNAESNNPGLSYMQIFVYNK